MKKIASFLLVLLVFNSCSENVKFNDVAFQALKTLLFGKHLNIPLQLPQMAH